MSKPEYSSTDKIPAGEVLMLPVHPIHRLFGALQHDGPAVTAEEMEQAAAEGAREE